MKKILSQILVLVVSIAAAHASNGLKNEGHGEKPVRYFQNPYQGESNGWFASAGVGAQIYFGDHDKQLATGKRITGGFEVSGGKWLTESIGIRVNVNAAKMKGLTQHGATSGLSTGKLYRAEDDLWYQEFNYIHAHADFMFNWTNDIDPANINGFYHLIPYAGIGIISATNKQKGTSLAFNLGILNTFKVSNKWSVYADARGAFFRDKVDGEVGGRNFDGLTTVLFGASYAF